MALNPISRNKKKKKAAIGQKANKQHRTQSIKEDKYNAALKLAIEEEKKNEMQEFVNGKDKNKQFNLTIESYTNAQL